MKTLNWKQSQDLRRKKPTKQTRKDTSIFARMTVNPRTSVATDEPSSVQQSLRHKVIHCKIFVSDYHLLQKTSVMFGYTGSKDFC